MISSTNNRHDLRRLLRYTKVAFLLCLATTPAFAQPNEPIVPLEVGNTWYYHAAYARDNRINDLWKITKEITGFTSDSSAVVLSRSFYLYADTAITNIEYWKNSGNKFYMGPSPVYRNAVYDGDYADTARFEHAPYGGNGVTIWYPARATLFGTIWRGETRIDSSWINMYAGAHSSTTITLAVDLGPVYVKNYDQDVFGSASISRATLRAALLHGVLLGDTSYALSMFPRVLAGAGYSASPPADIGATTITNMGNMTLSIVSIASSNPSFQPDHQSLTISPHDSATVSVRFTPSQLGEVRGTITFMNDQGISDELHVVGDGRGGKFSPQASRVDLGTHPCGVSFDSSLVITNRGNEKLIVWNIQVSDFRFRVRMDTVQLLPGQSSLLRLTFRPNFTAEYECVLAFQTNSINGSDTLTIRGYGSPGPPPVSGQGGVLRLPSEGVDLGTHFCNLTFDTSLIITNVGNEGLSISNIRSTNFRFQSRVDAALLGPGSSTNLTVTFRPNTLDETDGQLILETTSIAGPETLAVYGHGIFGPKAVFRRKVVDFSTVEIGTFKDDSLIIANEGNEDLAMPGKSVWPQEFVLVRSPQYLTAPGNSTQAVLRFAPGAKGPYSGKYIQSWGWSGTLDTVFLQGVGTLPPARLASFERLLGFGGVFLGAHRDTVITLRNIGADTLRVNSIRSTNEQFLPLSSTESIAPGDSLRLSLRFAPDKVGIFSGVLVISSNSPGSPDSLFLSGSGISTKGVRPMAGIPSQFFLEQNYPNPFNPTTTVRFGTTEAATVELSVYNTQGQRVVQLFNEQLPAGTFEFSWNASGFASGVYLLRLQAGSLVEIKKSLLLK